MDEKGGAASWYYFVPITGAVRKLHYCPLYYTDQLSTSLHFNCEKCHLSWRKF
jgi:hypothetical protein